MIELTAVNLAGTWMTRVISRKFLATGNTQCRTYLSRRVSMSITVDAERLTDAERQPANSQF